MGATDAERARRYRRHRKGDHTLCDPSRCDGTTPVTDSVTPRPARPRGMGARAARMWREEDGDTLTGGQRALLEEACRIVDRLDRLDAILDGDPGEWLRFRVSEDGSEVTVTVDRALDQARQQAAVLKQIIGELRQAGAGKQAGQGGHPVSSGKAAGGVISLATEAAKRRPPAAR